MEINHSESYVTGAAHLNWYLPDYDAFIYHVEGPEYDLQNRKYITEPKKYFVEKKSFLILRPDDFRAQIVLETKIKIFIHDLEKTRPPLSPPPAEEKDIPFKESLQYLTKKGHYVRSKAERRIDNTLTNMGVNHIYEKPIILSGKEIRPDWYLPEYEAYIEYWGLEGKQEYDQTQKWKLKLYAEHKEIQVLSIDHQHMSSQRRLENKTTGKSFIL